MVKFTADELRDLCLLTPRILCEYHDPNRGPYKIVYVYANTTDNEESSFLRAIELATKGVTGSIGICEGDHDRGYEGFDHSTARLKELGFPTEVPIVKFDIGGNVNTASEAHYLAKYAENIQGDIGIIAPPFHLVRAFMTTITALAGAPVRVYAECGIPLPWNEKVRHSQGQLVNTRARLLADELERLEKYRQAEFGEMLTPKKVLEYLDWRDR